MYIHEYQAKEMLARYGLAVPRGRLVCSARDASRAAESLGGPGVLKAQIHAGGRGAAGGVRTAASPEEAATVYEALIGTRLFTKQTGPAGKRVRRVYIEEILEPKLELYLALALDRASGKVAISASAQGGMGIEASGGLASILVDPVAGPQAYALRKLARALGVEAGEGEALAKIIRSVFALFVELDASLVEINPLALGGQGFVALDAKVAFDDNALFRHPELLDLRDIEEEEAEEFEASKYGLSLIRLEGSIGCLVNGAGLAMATLDAIAALGARPANFLDLGGAASANSIRRAFEILTADQRVEVALVNIFGGIVRCDEVARGILAGLETRGRGIPMVVRFDGNRAEEGRAVLRRLGPMVRFAASLEAAATAASEFQRGGI